MNDEVQCDGKWVEGEFDLGGDNWYNYLYNRAKKRVIKNEDELRELLNSENDRIQLCELVIEEGCGNEMKDDLELCGFVNLRLIVLKKKSLMNLNSLKVSENRRLERIETEDGCMEGEHVCEIVKSVIIESVNDYCCLI